MPAQMPDCFCNQEGMQTCDWVVEADIKYYRKGSDAVNSSVHWTLDEIPQPLAQIILQAMVASVNEQGFDVYVEWMKACHGGESEMAEMLARVFKDAKIG